MKASDYEPYKILGINSVSSAMTGSSVQQHISVQTTEIDFWQPLRKLNVVGWVVVDYLWQWAITVALSFLRACQSFKYNDIISGAYFIKISCSGKRAVSYDSWVETVQTIQDKVLSDERSTAYVTDIDDINKYLLYCKECNWYKSSQTIFSEARLAI